MSYTPPDADEVVCYKHGDWRLHVYGGFKTILGKCSCSKPDNGDLQNANASKTSGNGPRIDVNASRLSNYVQA
jgi:hypothetical protein